MESSWKGLSGMDAARATMGQGWPFDACPWNDDGANEPGAKRRAGWRGKPFWFLLGRLPKGTRPAGRNQCLSQLDNQQRHTANDRSHAPRGNAVADALRLRGSGAPPDRVSMRSLGEILGLLGG